MKYYTIQNDNILIADTKETLSRFYDGANIFELPEDYETGKYIIAEQDIEEEIEVPDYDEEGNPIMIEYEDTETVIDYDKKKMVKVLVPNPDWEKEQKQKERERLDSLILTPSDVERALYYSELQMDFEDLKALIKEKAPQIDLKGLAIEFRANNFYRGAVDKDDNRIIDMVGKLLGYTSDDMDYLFVNKKLPEKVQPEPADTNSDTDTDTDTNYVHIGDNTDNMEVTTNNDEYINIEGINESTTNNDE